MAVKERFNLAPRGTFTDLEDKPFSPLVRSRVCSHSCHLPGCGRKCQFEGTMAETEFCLGGFAQLFGPYVAGGWEMENSDQQRRLLGFGNINGMMMNVTSDPKGCKIEPCGLVLGIDCTDPCKLKFKLYNADGEVPDGFVPPEDLYCWYLIWGC